MGDRRVRDRMVVRLL